MSGIDGTHVYYNGVWLRNVLTKQFDQSVEYDPSGTDRLYTKFNITVESFVSDDVVNYNGSCLGGFFATNDQKIQEQNGGSAQQKMKLLHALLTRPRAEFRYITGEEVIVAANAEAQSFSNSDGSPRIFTNTTDLNNGPKPRSVSVTQVIGNRCFRVSFSIEVCVTICEYDTDSLNKYFNPQFAERKLLSNRFSIEETRDGNFLNTRTIVGRARVAHIALWGLDIRYLVLPVLFPGYKRESVHFAHGDNGLDLAYRITDKQRHAAPPWPAIDFAGTHTEGSGIAGTVSEGSISVRMVGEPGCAKRALLSAAVAVAESRIGKIGKTGLTGQVNPSVLVNHIQITDALHDNVIELNMQFSRHGAFHAEGEEASEEEQRFGNAMYSRLGLLPSVFRLKDGDPSLRMDGRMPLDVWPRQQDPWGYEGVPPYGIFCSYLQDGCIPQHKTLTVPPIVAGNTGTLPPDVDFSRSYTRESLGEDLPPPGGDGQKQDEKDKQSEEHQKAPYTVIEVQTDYFNDYGLVALPYIKSTGDKEEPEDGDVLVTRLHAPVCRKNIFMTAKRIGAQPKFPKLDYRYTDANGITYYLDEFHPEFAAPKQLPDGINYEYQICARIVYLMSRALKQDDDLSMGSLPWDNTKKEDNKVSINTDQQDEEMA